EATSSDIDQSPTETQLIQEALLTSDSQSQDVELWTEAEATNAIAQEEPPAEEETHTSIEEAFQPIEAFERSEDEGETHFDSVGKLSSSEAIQITTPSWVAEAQPVDEIP